MKKSFFMMMLLCCGFGPAMGQQGTAGNQKQLREPYLKGMVVDFVSRSRISAAKVSIDGTNWVAYTNEQGEFEVSGWKPGTYTIRVVHPHYRPLVAKNFGISRGGVYAGFILKSGKPDDKPITWDHKPLGQFVIDEDATPIQKTQPVYPPGALQEKVEGTVMLLVQVNEEGDVLAANITEGVRDDLNRAALEAVQFFKFKPAKVKGKPVAVAVPVPIDFKLALH